MTNIIAFLHTTTAYKAAALQLMAGQANFVAQQMDLKEPLPIIVSADTNKSEVMPPPWGVGGSIRTSNYYFNFQKGWLESVGKIDWLKKISPPVTNTFELANQTSLLDTNSAYELAKQWLTKISVDVPKLEQKYPPEIFQVTARRRDENGEILPGISNTISIPLFMIAWGNTLQRFM